MCDREHAAPGGDFSEFAQKQFDAAGLGDVAVRVRHGEPLSRANAERLAHTSLPLLAQLVSLRPDHVQCTRPALDPVLFLPMSEWLATDSEEVVQKAVSAIRAAAAQLTSLVKQDERVRRFGDCVRTLCIASDVPKNRLRDTFQDKALRHLQEVCQAEGSVSPSFPSEFGQASHLSQPIHDLRALAADLIAARDLIADQTLASWQPEMTTSLDQDAGTAREALAADAMRAIAMARLVLPEHVNIRAPAGRLGIKTAHVALSFGASHLGDVAVDAATATALNIPTLADLAEALRYDTPTPV